MIKAKGYAAQTAESPLAPWNFERREVGPHDVQFDIQYCGICHSDLHQVRNEWGGSIYPMVPGHELVGKVTKVGSHVKKFKEGDVIAMFINDTWQSGRGDVLMTSYQRIGQHAGACPSLLNELEDAKPSEYKALLHELRHLVGYKVKVVKGRL